MLKFNPPQEEAKKLPKYASYAAGVMKTHNGIGFAKNSLNNRMWTWAGSLDEGNRRRVTTYAAILENVDGTWYTLYEIPEGSTKDELPWMKDYLRTTYGTVLYSDHLRSIEHYQNRVSSGQYSVIKKATPMTRDEYVDWRLAVERERVQTAFRETQVERLISQ